MTTPAPTVRRSDSVDSQRTLLGDEGFLRSLEQLALLVRRVARPGLSGEHRGLTRSNSVEFADYRPYAPGDDFRRIDWNLYGRMDALFVRLSEAREDVDVHLLLDASRSMEYGQPNKLGYAKRLVAALGYIALSRLDRVSLSALTYDVVERAGPLRGKDRIHRLLSFLDAMNAAGTTDLNAALRRYAQLGQPHGVAILVSDLLSPSGFRAGIERLRADRVEVIVLQVLAPQELQPTPTGDVELIDRETGEIVEVTLSEAVVREYQRRLAAWTAEIAQVCAELGVSFSQVSTATPLETLVVTELRKRRILL
ncbi:MAG: DUF58 domain-containing protein [Chloroflexota bacterium]|nr:DUF58 domain-containing protein [Dehalococcoidia bacterium]MDW8254073.1 DUF58 domain-containing protein [Chloroflexota bacterium]